MVHDSSPHSRQRVPAGTRLNGIFEVERLVATGGMGEIYRGRAIQTGDPVAIKMIRADLAENESVLTLFRKEASALHNLHHEAIVRYYVFSIDPDLDCPYLAMEFVEGQSLSETLRKGPLGVDAARTLQRRLAAGLHAAHELGIVHRDVSPDNVILPGGNPARAKIIDFGIARNTQLGTTTVIGGGFAGKYGYVSPEQLGLYGGEVGPCSDIYSLGLVLAEALTGKPLDMGGTQAQVLEKRRRVPDLSGVDARMRPLIERMLQPRPADRPASMAQVAAWNPAETSSAGRMPRYAAVLVGGLVVLGASAYFVVPQFLRERPTVDAGRTDAPVPPPPELTPTSDPASPPAQAPAAPTPAPTDAPLERDPGPAPASVPLAPSGDPAAAIRAYVDGYDGGSCFLLLPLAVDTGSASIEGYGSSPVPFQAFDEAFRRANGFEAHISLRQVTAAQCPAVEFMSSLSGPGHAVPQLRIDSFRLRNTEPLSGAVEDVGEAHVDVLLVADDGFVYNLSPDFTRRSNGTVSFNLRIERAGGRGPRPQVVIAVVSRAPLATIAGGKPIPAETLFPQLLDEAARTDQRLGVAAKYFMLDT